MPPGATLIREYHPRDARQVEECIVELQDFCKQIDPLAGDGHSGPEVSRAPVSNSVPKLMAKSSLPRMKAR
jgi:hypothetical protein